MPKEPRICRFCKQDTSKVDGCRAYWFFEPATGEVYEPVRVGEQDRGDVSFDQCICCGAKKDHYHHDSCLREICPYCGGQLIDHSHSELETVVLHLPGEPLPPTSPAKCCLNCEHAKTVYTNISIYPKCVCYLDLDKGEDLDDEEILAQGRDRGDGASLVCSHWRKKAQ